MHPLLEKLAEARKLSLEEWSRLLACHRELLHEAGEAARAVCVENFGHSVFYRGIIEFSNHCKNGCRYCGLQAENSQRTRMRLTESEILDACREGFSNGVMTFVLQSGEDAYYTDERLVPLLRHIREEFPDCAVTLSIGERGSESLKSLFAAGARRYLLRHETANPLLYRDLHGARQSFWERIHCLYTLKAIGYQTGCGMMIGVPGQKLSDIALDLQFIQAFRPEMLGIGPFIPNSQTEFAGCSPGDAELTLYVMSLCRLLLPRVLLPATTALRTLIPEGLARALLHGCNVVMPSLTPGPMKNNYKLYDKSTEQRTLATTLEEFQAEIRPMGYSLVRRRGDFSPDKEGES
ncbi:MAG: [FeFe] hydrogenase H-cluster radical SAM maturase HydE [Desulfovibrio sp.]|nr:[FeFe] hydrogenase H-cluster radical SAM maturase HydE [Desulfovibrio sp.]